MRQRRPDRIAKGAQGNAGLGARHRPAAVQTAEFRREFGVRRWRRAALLKSVDGKNEISKCVRLVNQHRDATRRQTFPNAHRPWQSNRNVVAPTIASKTDRLALVGAIVAVRNETVRDHCSAEKFDGSVL